MTGLPADSPTRIVLRPGITNPSLWYPERPPQAEWGRIRKAVLERDDYKCCACGHRALKFMNVHHLDDSRENTPDKLATICVACHAVLHIGRNLDLGVIEIWESVLPQVEIVRRTRDGVRSGKELCEINATLDLTLGPHPPDSILYANDLAGRIGDQARAYLSEPLCAAFVNLQRWQVE